MVNNVRAVVGITIAIVSDGAWSHRGWSANECVVHVFDYKSSNLLDMEIVVRKLSSDNYGNYEGASCQMEAFGLREICKRLSAKGVQVGGIIHDGFY